MPFVIEELYAIVAIGPDGDEGIASYLDPTDGVMKPLVGSKRAIPRMLEVSRAIEIEAGVKLTLTLFSNRRNIEVVRG